MQESREIEVGAIDHLPELRPDHPRAHLLRQLRDLTAGRPEVAQATRRQRQLRSRAREAGVSYPPGQQPPTWGPGQQPPAWSQQPPPPWGGPPQQYSVNPSKAGTSPVVIVGVFIGILVLVIGIAAVLIFASQPPPPTAPCQPGVPCAPGGPSLPPIANASPTPAGPAVTPEPHATSAPPATPRPSGQPTSAPGSQAPVETPTSDSPPVVMGGSSWHSESLDFGFEYNGERFQLSSRIDRRARDPRTAVAPIHCGRESNN